MINLNSFKHNDWIKIWEGNWSFLSCSHFGDEYTKEIRFGPRPFVSQSIIFARHHRSSGWITQKDRDLLGTYLAAQVVKNPQLAKTISNRLKIQAKGFLKFIAQNENTKANFRLYNRFWRKLLVYYRAHINVKYVVDYLRPDLLRRNLPDLQDARLFAEPVLNRTEDFMLSFAKLLSKKAGYDYKLLLCLTKAELRRYFKDKKLPKKYELKQRYEKSVFLHNQKSFNLLIGHNVQKAEKLVHQMKKTSLVKGSPAYPGKVIGIVRIISNPRKDKGFKAGNILVTGATRPEFLPIMQKAAAFVTDAGGILSHAAITARELKKPCVIGTKIATKVFKDGDLVEVDANKGTVKLIKNTP